MNPMDYCVGRKFSNCRNCLNGYKLIDGKCTKNVDKPKNCKCKTNVKYFLCRDDDKVAHYYKLKLIPKYMMESENCL